MLSSFANVFGDRSGWPVAPGCCARSWIAIQRAVPSGLVARYRGPHLAVVRGLGADAWDLQALDHFLDRAVGHRAGAGPDDKAQQAVTPPRRVVERHEPAARNADEVELPKSQERRQRLQVVGHRAGLRTRRRVRRALAPSAPVERDSTIAGPAERRHLRRPGFARAGVRVKEHDGLAGPARVGEPQPHPREVGECLARGGSRGRSACCANTPHGSADARTNRRR